MTLARLLLRSLAHFWRADLGVAIGLAVAATVITGALIVGDSMRYTLGRIADQRLGDVEHAVIGGDRFFTADFATGVAPGAGAGVLLDGVVSTPDGRSRANGVAVAGIDGPAAELVGVDRVPEPGDAFINTTLAQRLEAQPGDTLILRVPEPSALPIDAALVNASKPALAIRLQVRAVVDADAGGRFSLRAEQRAPMNLFVDRAWLAEQLDQPGRANIALSRAEPGPLRPALADLELSLRQTPAGQQELTTPRVFIDAPIERDLADLPGRRLLTYMVNTVALGDSASPYAMICASDGLGGLSLDDDEIALNTWLAEDLGASVGDSVTLTYYLPDEGDRLVEDTTQLTVARIVPIEGVFADRTLTPDFPGLAEAEQLSRWDAGPAIDRSRIRDKDEAYWDVHRATPKAFINLATGQRLWSNRFGTLTAIRFDTAVTEDALVNRIEPGAIGLAPIDLAAQAEQAAAGTVDFGQLFLSLSGFIIIAAVLLAATLFVMSAEQRARQFGLLLAVGLNGRQVLVVILGEALLVALVGAVLGAAGGVGYGYLVTEALSGVWSGAVAGSAVQLHSTTLSLIVGPISAVVVGLGAIAWSVRLLTRRPARELLAGAVGRVSGPPRLGAWVWGASAAVLLIAALALTLTQLDARGGMQAALIGFGGGALMLIGLIALLTAGLVALSVTGSRSAHRARPLPTMTSTKLAGRNLTRRRGRTLAAVATLASGVFMVIAVAGFRLGSVEDPSDRASGTGGFALLVETSQPIRYDLNTSLGRDHYALARDELPPGSVVPMRVSDGDDASCLNLNQTPTPRLLGGEPELLSERGAFTFRGEVDPGAGWAMLNREADGDTIPAIADANTAQWALKLGLGDTLTLTDERGQPFTLRLVGTLDNSVLQGSLIVSEAHFKRLFPSTSGHRMLLVDADSRRAADVRASVLSEVLADEGAAVTLTAARLAEYNTVQNTYLVIFQLLGGLGVVLGALGLGVITARNLIERRPELALMLALGLTRHRLRAIVLTEQAVVLIAGLGIGVGGAAVATAHTGSLLGGNAARAAVTVLATLGVGLLAVLCGLGAAKLGTLPQSLRND